MLNPIAFKVPMQNNMSVRVEECNDKHDYDLVHFHEECQLTCIIKGKGSLLAGTGTYEFLPGEVYLFGSNMPHGFISHDHEDEVELESSPSKISVFFKRDAFDSMFVQNPETAEIKTLLDNASLGYRLSAQNSVDVLSKIQNLVDLDGFDRVLGLLQILDAISKSNVGHYLSDEREIGKSFVDKDILRINEIFAYTESHFQEKITLSDVAGYFKMTPPTFSRFFKSRTQKTYIQFLIEMRISKACEFIKKGTYNTTESCFNSGFTNISSFHRHFKNIVGMTPTQYKLRVSSKYY